jgi:hypothetical protein
MANKYIAEAIRSDPRLLHCNLLLEVRQTSRVRTEHEQLLFIPYEQVSPFTPLTGFLSAIVYIAYMSTELNCVTIEQNIRIRQTRIRMKGTTVWNVTPCS